MGFSFYPNHEHKCSHVSHCLHCDGTVRELDKVVLIAHLQEDIIDGRCRVVLYRHEAARCEDCGKFMQKPGDGEILNGRIGPYLRSAAIYLRNVIGISYRKIPQAIEELFGRDKGVRSLLWLIPSFAVEECLI